MSYKVHLIPSNLRKNETIVQIADSLDHLSRVVNDILLNIERRADQCSNKLKDVSSRVDVVDSKISQLKSVKNAIHVFSSSKYPAYDNETAYISIFPTNTNIPIVKHDVSKKYQLKRDEPIDKLHVYHVKLSKLESEKIDGLGQFPNGISCISDLIFYNSGKNPYKEFSKSSSVKIYPSIKTEHQKIQIGTAPASITERSSFSNLPNQEYFYSPDLGDVPSLDVPLDLPDLPGIASNVRYEEDNSFGIAPSVALSPAMRNNSEGQETLSSNLDGLPEIIPSALLLPLNKAEMTLDNQRIEEVKVTQLEIIVQEEKPIPIIIKDEKPVAIASKLPAAIDARASLMEAIREAGGSKILKSAENEPASPKHEATTGDLMADLHAKLAMRRKGISGAKKNLENVEFDSRGALSLMSALIPPPEEMNEETEEEEWE